MNIDDQLKIIMKGVDEIIGVEDLREKLISGKTLTVKLGLDPSAPDIHLGHTVVLRKMKQLQDLGHKVVIIIGDFTGKIGDPTGKSRGRKALTDTQVMDNARTYEEQIFKVLNKDKTEVRFNSEWLSKLKLDELIKLASTTTVARMLEREDFKKRYESQIPIGIHEFFYPLMQGFDSVAIEADIELGGTDQRFNVLMGRMLQKEFNQNPQTTIFMPLLEGLDGKEKMSKSLGNYIGIDEPAEVMYEKTMTLPDELIIKYFNLVTDIHPDKINKIEDDIENNRVNPRDVKMNLAKEIVTLYHGSRSSDIAEERFKNIFQQGKIPNDILTVKVKRTDFNLEDVLVTNNMIKSKSELRRLVNQGGVKANSQKVTDLSKIDLLKDLVIQIGKKKFIKINFD